MTELLISLTSFILVISGVLFFLYKKNDFNWFHFCLYIILLLTWITMFMFKANPNISNKGFLKNHWWTWPIVISIYQFTQVFVRLPLGKLSQRLRSRKEPITLVMFIMLIGLVLVISSNFADWAIIIGIICSGVMGASFGMNAQYWSENWNIKKGFYSTIVVFTIPFAAKMFAKFINTSFLELNINLFWVVFISISLLSVVLIVYNIYIKEDKNTIFIDNMDPKAKPFVNKKMSDVISLSLSTSLIVGSFTFMTYVSYSLASLNDSLKMILPIGQIIFVILIPVLFTKFIKIWTITFLSKIILFTSLIILSCLIITNNINIPIIITLMFFANIAFGSFISIMFSSALHFDHKFPALVLGIFLTFKSLLTGTTEISAQLIINKNIDLSLWTIGWISLGVNITLFSTSTSINLYKKVFKNGENINKSIIEESYNFEKKVLN